MFNENRPTDRRDAALGAILGACVGDATGAKLEFIAGTPTDAEVDDALTLPGGGCWRVAPGQITDDGELTLSLARALADGGFDIERIARSYALWIDSRPFDVGIAIRNALGCFREPKDSCAAVMKRAAAEQNQVSKANGSLMRATPLGVWGAAVDDQQLAECARADSRLSHPNPSCTDAVASYAIAIATLIRSLGDRDAAFTAAENCATGVGNAEVISWLEDARQKKRAPYSPHIGFVRIGFTHAFRHLLAGSDYVTAVRETIAGGGDTDTNACIVGGLIGAACGAESIPAALREKVLGCSTEGGRPRPEWLHASQIPELVDLILAINGMGG